ncbi:hypothetical protein STEG23_029919 [Scotinomys teguina]
MLDQYQTWIRTESATEAPYISLDPVWIPELTDDETHSHSWSSITHRISALCSHHQRGFLLQKMGTNRTRVFSVSGLMEVFDPFGLQFCAECCRIVLVMTSITILNQYGESEKPCLVPDISGIALSSSPCLEFFIHFLPLFVHVFTDFFKPISAPLSAATCSAAYR